MRDPLLTSGHVRSLRTRPGVLRASLLAWLGAGDLTVIKLGDSAAWARTRAAERGDAALAAARRLRGQLAELSTSWHGEELRAGVDHALDMAQRTYTELAGRGQHTLDRINTQPKVADALNRVAHASERFDTQVEEVVDEMHDASEEALGRMSLETWTVRERAARATQRLAREAVDTVTPAARG